MEYELTQREQEISDLQKAISDLQVCFCCEMSSCIEPHKTYMPVRQAYEKIAKFAFQCKMLLYQK